jgi:N-formylglutamate amidohydrolase
VDLNRAPGGEELYGAPAPPVPLESFAGEPLYRQGLAPDAAEVGRRIADYWTPYHEALAFELERLRGIHGHALLIDAHSIRSRVPRLFEGRLPDLNLGSFHGRSADPALIRRAHAGLAAGGGWDEVLDGRFVGGYITRRYGQPGQGVHALQLELSQRTYLDERTGEWDRNAAARLRAHLRFWVEELLEWRSPRGGEDGD